MALPLFSATLFLSAFVLFLVQPMVGKLVLPRLGGTPQVWNTCMMFFQLALLAGYAYAHVASTRLPFRKHLMVHCAMLVVPILLLFALFGIFGIGPFDFSGFTPTTGGNPVLSTLAWLTMLVGLPFLVVSTTSPLLQRWFSHTGHESAKDPYFLSTASNAGSLIGLLGYVAVVEPLIGLHSQAILWWVLFALLAGSITLCAATVWKNPGAPFGEAEIPETVGPLPVEMPLAPPPPPPPPQPAPAQATGITARKKFGKGKPAPAAAPESAAAALPARVSIRSDEVTWMRRMRWMLLSAAPVSFMLSVVTYICVDLSPIPLLWVVPLALYLVTFILAFARWPVVWVDAPHRLMLFIQPVLVLLMIFLYLYTSFADTPLFHIGWPIAAFFVTAVVCHGELALDRPRAKHLTEFWLWVSVGGAVGGIFNGLIAPVIFWGVVEFPIAIVLGFLAREQRKTDGWTENFLERYTPSLVAWFRNKGDEIARKDKKPEPHSTYVLNYTLDVVLPVLLGSISLLLIYLTLETWGWRKNPDAGEYNSAYVFWRNRGYTPNTAWSLANVCYNAVDIFLPGVICFLYYNRPIRLGLGVAAILLTQVGYKAYTDETEVYSPKEGVIYASRSYFGVLRVNSTPSSDGNFQHSLMHGSTHHGLNYQFGPYRRMATTYYHTFGPAGVVMLKYNWFHDGWAYPEENLKEQEKLTNLIAQETVEGLKAQYQAELSRVRASFNNRGAWVDSMLTHRSDARLPASEVGLAVADLGTGLPLTSLVGAWSEPPYATIGLGTGTMGAYGRAFQHVHYYEIDNKIRRLNIPQLTDEEKTKVKEEAGHVAGLDAKFNNLTAKLLKDLPAWEQKRRKDLEARAEDDKLSESQQRLLQLLELRSNERTSAQRRTIERIYLSSFDNYGNAKTEFDEARRELFNLGQGPYFNYVMDARGRAAELQVRMGDARLRMNFPYPAYDADKPYAGYSEQKEVDGIGEGGGPDSFYHMMVVDAFSSDAIPIHLITKEAVEMYFTKLVPDGILCVHTSNRHVALVPVVEAVAKTIKTADPETGATTDADGKPLTLVTRRAHDNSPYGLPGHFTSEWVMVARSRKILEKLATPPGYEEVSKDGDRASFASRGADESFIDREISRRENAKYYSYWLWPEERTGPDEIHLKAREAWTDDYSNVLRVFRWESGHGLQWYQIGMLLILALDIVIGIVIVMTTRNER